MNRFKTLQYVLLTLIAVLTAIPPVAAKDTAQHIVVGTTTHITLDKAESQDYTISLNRGDYYIILDAQRSDMHPSNIQATVQLLKKNGVVIDSSFLHCNEIGQSTRVGKTFHQTKPLAARLRLTHDQEIPMDFWLTVEQTSATTLVPFGFGGVVNIAKVGTDVGVGGTLDNYASAYYTAILPAGKWSISLGLSTADGSNTNLQAQVDLLDNRGIPTQEDFVHLNEIDVKTRKEGILTVTKPKQIIFRVLSGNNKVYNYDLTIEKDSD